VTGSSSASDRYERILSDLRARSLLRKTSTIEEVHGPEVTIDGRRLINFASNDYLGLSQHPSLKTAAQKAIERFGVGAGASRLVTGSQSLHKKLEQELAAFKGTESALLFGSGYAAAIGTLCSLIGPGDIILLDKLVHACIIDGAKLSGAIIRVYPHNNVAKLKQHLLWARKNHPHKTVLIATESVFSMDGDLANLAAIVRLKNEEEALLFVDEAHATGVVGPRGTGLVNALGLTGEVDIQMGTLSKAIGVSGGFICGSDKLVQLLVNRARSFIYSTSPPPALAAAASASLQILQSDEGEQLRTKLWQNIRLLSNRLEIEGNFNPRQESAIIPLLVGAEERSLRLAEVLLENGFLIPAIRYPTVARGSARMRIALSAAHFSEQIDALATVINGWHWKGRKPFCCGSGGGNKHQIEDAN
jgi:8-amino-7-oxononanoate synthase